MLRRTLALAALVLAAAPAAGCAPACDMEHVCSLIGEGAGDPKSEVCDGKNYFPCDYSITGRRIQCTVAGKPTPRFAVCTATGWTFENK